MPPVVNEFCLPPSLLSKADSNGRSGACSVKPATKELDKRFQPGLVLSNGAPQETSDSLIPKRVTIYDIAKKVGVSHTTVARALGNRKEVSRERREEIQRVASELGYSPDPHLAALANYRRTVSRTKFQGNIVWVNHWKQPEQLRKFSEFEKYWLGATSAAEKFGFKLEDVRWPLDCSAKRFENMLLARGVEGVLIPPHNEAPDWADFDWVKFSVVRFGLSVPLPVSNLVTSDQFRSVVMAVTHIREYGYQRIGLAADTDLDEHLGGNYYSGFVWAQKNMKVGHAVPPFPANAKLYRRSPEKELRNLQRWLVRHNPDAILTTQSYLPDLIRRLGLRIPEDIAVAGTSVCDIPVSAGIDQRSTQIGRIAMEMLIKQINMGERGASGNPCRILIESCWQDGDSVPRRSNVLMAGVDSLSQ